MGRLIRVSADCVSVHLSETARIPSCKSRCAPPHPCKVCSNIGHARCGAQGACNRMPGFGTGRKTPPNGSDTPSHVEGSGRCSGPACRGLESDSHGRCRQRRGGTRHINRRLAGGQSRLYDMVAGHLGGARHPRRRAHRPGSIRGSLAVALVLDPSLDMLRPPRLPADRLALARRFRLEHLESGAAAQATQDSAHRSAV